MPRGNGRGKNKKTPAWGNPLGQDRNPGSMMAALVHHSGFSSHQGVPLQPVAGSSNALNIVSSPGINSQFVHDSNELAPLTTVATSQLAPNMDLHELLAFLSSHSSLQSPAAQANATNLVIQNQSSLPSWTPQGQNLTPQNYPAGSRFPVSVLSIPCTNTWSASPQPQVFEYPARPVFISSSQATSVSSRYLSNSASSPLDLTTTTQTGLNEESSNPHLVNNIRPANTPVVGNVGLPIKMPLSPKKLLPKNVTFHMLPSNVEKPFPLSDVRLYNKDGFGAKVLQIGRLDTEGIVGVILDQAFPVLVGHPFNIVTERSHQAGARQFVFQKEGPPSGIEVHSAPLRGLILYIQPHVTLSGSVVRTVSNAPIPQVIWRYKPTAPKTTNIEDAAHDLTPLSSVQLAMPSESGPLGVMGSSSSSEVALDYSILGSSSSLNGNDNAVNDLSSLQNPISVALNVHSNEAMPTSLMTNSTENITSGFELNPALDRLHRDNSVSRVLGAHEYPGISSLQQAVAPSDTEETSLRNNYDNCLQAPNHSDLTSSPQMAFAQTSQPLSENSAGTSNIVDNLESRALEILANASRNTTYYAQRTQETQRDAANSSQENIAGELQRTSSTSARTPSLFRFNSRLTSPYHEGVACRRPSVLQYPRFHPSARLNQGLEFVGTSSAPTPNSSPEAQSECNVARRNTGAENSLQPPLTPVRALNLRLGRSVFFDLIDDRLDGYEPETPQGYYLHLLDRDAGRRRIRIRRKSFKDTFLRYYINVGTENVNLKRALRVAFIRDDGEDEPAADAGGPRGEYIGMLRQQLQNGFWQGLPLFDYGDNGILPTRVDAVANTRTFFAVGLAFADLFFNSGASIDGMSPHVISLLKKMNNGIHLYVENVTQSELLDDDIEEAFEILTGIANKEHNPATFLDRLQLLLMEWNVTIPDDLNYRSALQKRNSVVQSYFVKSRFSALWDLFEGLKAGGVMDYLNLYPDKWELLFPRKGSLTVTAEEIMENIEFRDADGALLSDDDGHEPENFESIVRQYISNIAGDGSKLRHFLMCVTGFDVITPGKIFVEPQFDPVNEQVKISSCAKTIAVPVLCTVEYFALAIGLELDFNRG